MPAPCLLLTVWNSGGLWMLFAVRRLVAKGELGAVKKRTKPSFSSRNLVVDLNFAGELISQILHLKKLVTSRFLLRRNIT